ncbi:MAG: DUF5752 family protein [Caldimicrobium sp.]
MSKPFVFKAEFWLPKATGIKVNSLKDFIATLRSIDESSVFYHTYANIFNYHNLPTHYNNSFAYWLYKNNYLVLAEKISVIDPLEYYDLEELRRAFLTILDEYYTKNPEEKVVYPFIFIAAEREILECNMVANNLEEFINFFKTSSINSLFYHLITSRLENKTLINDYSAWLSMIGEPKKAELINNLDIYSMNMYEIKKEIIKILER